MSAEPKGGPFRAGPRGAGRSLVHRDWGFTGFTFVLGGLVLGVALGLGWLFRKLALVAPQVLSGVLEAFAIGVPVLGGVLALLVVSVSLWGGGDGECPSCGQRLGLLSTRKNEVVFCSACARHCEGKRGELTPLDDARVFDMPVLKAPFVAGVALPDVCAACGEPSSLRKPVELKGLEGGAMRVLASVDVPLCAAHAAREPLKLERGSTGPIVAFASHAALRAYCRDASVDPVA